MSKNSPLIGLIGAGKWGRNLARNFYKIGNLHTLCDLDATTLIDLRSCYPDITITSNYYDILQNPAIKAVVIATPAVTHYTLAKEALLSGKDIYVEKPFCITTDEAKELFTLAEQLKLVAMTGHLLQYHPCVLKIHELLQTSSIGRLRAIYSQRLNFTPCRPPEGALWDLAPHDLSLILSFTGQPLPLNIETSSIRNNQNIIEQGYLKLSFPSGLESHTTVSWISQTKQQKLVIEGTKGKIVFDDTASWEDKLLLYKAGQGSISIHVDYKEPLRQECLHFLECCRQRLLPRTGSRECLPVLEVLEKAHTHLSENCMPKESLALSF
ncbi:MAG: Gfo/Idh/MocA family protein [Chlamydiota bacterium]